MTFKLISPAFGENGSIPSQYTCDGDDISPPLVWSDVPSGTKSLALIMDDPDSPDPAKPQRVYVHWVVYNISPMTLKLPLNAAKSGLPLRALHGTNDWGKQTYGGPCPAIGKHRYFFKLYALDDQLKGLKNPTKAQVEEAMMGHLVDNVELVGTYEKRKT
ncbi:MAG: YbhB/YbcL family Raf kinase inhibitor-like protein [Acidobacteriota bacterium]|nr:YbhB/YbcL family Raf kinase inhibitor-like protein [Acidobacteriota bacterium]